LLLSIGGGNIRRTGREGNTMALQFVAEVGVYIPRRDAIKFTALTPSAHIDCFTTRSALAAIGCNQSDTPWELVERFQKNRLSIEIAALIKYRRSTGKPQSLDIAGEDLDGL
jgi:Protein of unknown function (DUF1488)